MRFLFLLLAAVGSLVAQTQNYVVTATTTAVTLQSGTAASAQTIRGNQAIVSCAAAQTATVSWNGTNATATAGTVLKVPGTSLNATATVWTGSNVSGSTTGPAYPVPAGQALRIDLSTMTLAGGGGIGQNITISTTGSCTTTILWSEG